MEFNESSGFIMEWDAWELNNTNPIQISTSDSALDPNPIQIPIVTSSKWNSTSSDSALDANPIQIPIFTSSKWNATPSDSARDANPIQIPISTSSKWNATPSALDANTIQIPISTSSNPIRIPFFNVPRAHRTLYGQGGCRAPPDPHFVCLKLHKPGDYIEDHAQMMASKKGKAVDDGVPRCQVDRCHVALSNAKDYNQRLKVCEAHSKAAKVSLLGLQQRFCQQCSRFHVVSEFEEAKRSCKRRLAWHNERRRKSPIESTTTNFSFPENNKMVTIGESFSYMYGNNNVHSLLLSNEADTWDITLELATQSSTALRELIAETRAHQLEASCGHYPGHVTLDLMQVPCLAPDLGFVPPGSRPSSASHVTKADEEEGCDVWSSF